MNDTTAPTGLFVVPVVSIGPVVPTPQTGGTTTSHQGVTTVMTIEALFRQCKMTAHDLMLSAKHDVDEVFGDGYAAKHPELVAAYMHAANYDLRSMVEHDDRERATEAMTEARRPDCCPERPNIGRGPGKGK